MNPKYVRRYTTFSSALDILMNQRLTLLNPSSWDDKNDVEFMDLYRAYKGVGSVLALCCAMAGETYHHWRIFTQGMEGICIEFDRIGIESSLKGAGAIIAQPVDYIGVKDLKRLTHGDADRLPFVKREGYKDEKEWRIIATIDQKAKQTHEVPINLSSIHRIILNPWLPPALIDNVRNVLSKNALGDHGFSIVASELTNSRKWKEAGRKLVFPAG